MTCPACDDTGYSPFRPAWSPLPCPLCRSAIVRTEEDPRMESANVTIKVIDSSGKDITSRVSGTLTVATAVTVPPVSPPPVSPPPPPTVSTAKPATLPPVSGKTIIVGPAPVTTLAAAAALCTAGGETVVVQDGVYTAGAEFLHPVTIVAATMPSGAWPRACHVKLDLSTNWRWDASKTFALSDPKPLVLDQAGLVFHDTYCVRGLEICGAVSANGDNGAGIRNDAGVGNSGTIEDCYIHNNQAGILHTGGYLTQRRNIVTHNGRGDQQHNVYYAMFGTTALGDHIIDGCWYAHSRNGNNIKSNANKTTVVNSLVGHMPLPIGSSTPAAYLTPGPNALGSVPSNVAALNIPPGSEWPLNHADAYTGLTCEATGETEQGKSFDIPHGGILFIDNCVVIKQDNASGLFIGVGYEGTDTRPTAGTVKNTLFICGRDPTYVGNRVPNSVVALSGCVWAGTFCNQQPVNDGLKGGVTFTGCVWGDAKTPVTTT